LHVWSSDARISSPEIAGPARALRWRVRGGRRVAECIERPAPTSKGRHCRKPCVPGARPLPPLFSPCSPSGPILSKNPSPTEGARFAPIPRILTSSSLPWESRLANKKRDTRVMPLPPPRDATVHRWETPSRFYTTTRIGTRGRSHTTTPKARSLASGLTTARRQRWVRNLDCALETASIAHD
jgi:hypothetical protein